MCVLGSMLLEREAIGSVVTILSADSFYRPDHQELFAVLVEMYEANKPVDLAIVREQLQTRGTLEHVGGVEYLVRLAESVPSAANIEYYAQIVKDKWMLRRLIHATGGILEAAYADQEDTRELLDNAEKELFDVTQERVSGQPDTLGGALRAAMAAIESDQTITGMQSGYTELDTLTGGFQHGDLIILAARPSMGKTAIGLNMCEYMGVDLNVPVAFFSLEMSRQQVVNRFLSGRAQVEGHKMRMGQVNGTEIQRLQIACGELDNAPIYVDETTGMTPLEVRAKARRLKMQHDIQAVFIDYLQLLHVPRAESRQVEIATISRNLKGLARELNIPVVALAQLNRGVEGREGHRPRMSDLRESGSIEQDADVILLLHREDYYKPNDEEIKGMAELIIAKQRNGPTATVDLVFRPQFTRFESAARGNYPEAEYYAQQDQDTSYEAAAPAAQNNLRVVPADAGFNDTPPPPAQDDDDLPF